MKKWVATVLALVLALGLCSVSWAAETGTLDTVFVNTTSGDDTKDGTTSENAVKSLKKAMELVKESGTVKVEGQTTANPFWGDQSTDKTIAGGHYYVTKSVTIEGTGNGMRDIHGIALPSDFNGKLTLRNIDFDGTAAIGIYDNGIGSQAELVIENCRFNKAGSNCVFIAPEVKSLTVTGCTFTGVDGASTQYLIWPKLAKEVTITNNTFNGGGKVKGAIHLGDGGAEAMNATITDNKINGVARGVTMAFATGKNDTVSIDNNTFTDVTEGAVVLHENMAANPTAKVTYGAGNVLAGTTAKEIVAKKGNNGTAVDAAKVVAAPAGSELVDNGDGTYSVKPAEQKPSNNYYYYSPSTTTTDTTKGSPKTFDAGVGVYAVTAVLSLSGMAWTAKKRH